MAKEATAGPLVDEAHAERIARPIRCRACDARISESSHAISVDGSHRHVFQNPGGLVFEIVCFRRADGCDSLGAPTFEATWFSAHSWSIAVCRRCGAHLGWAYWHTGELRFWGLIVERLIEAG
jgi:ribosomal protein L40E